MNVSKGTYIQLKRKEKNLKQEEVAKVIGVTKQYISLIETDKNIPSADILIKLSEVLNFSIDEFKETTRKIVATPEIHGFVKFLPEAEQLAEKVAEKINNKKDTRKALIKEVLKEIMEETLEKILKESIEKAEELFNLADGEEVSDEFYKKLKGN